MMATDKQTENDDAQNGVWWVNMYVCRYMHEIEHAHPMHNKPKTGESKVQDTYIGSTEMCMFGDRPTYVHMTCMR